MKAIIYERYGSPEVLKLGEMPKPVPKDNEILVKIHATAVNAADYRLRTADPFAVRFIFGLTKPKNPVLGCTFSGEVEAIGKNVKRFQIGDLVFGTTGAAAGTYAEYRCVAETSAVAIKPDNLTHEEAAVIPFGGTTALHFLKKANIQSGQKILIYGASGAVGTAAVQIAKYMGAEVTGVCSGQNADMVKSIGADFVVDYTKENFAKNGITYDVIMDTVNKMSISDALNVLQPNGILILSAAGLREMLRGAWISMRSSRKAMTGVIAETAESMEYLRTMATAGDFKPVIDQIFPLEKIAEAHTLIDTGHKKGNIAIKIL